MSKNTIITEFFGLPGCGKTTKCLSKQKEKQSAGKICVISEYLSVDYSKCPWWIKLRTVPIYIFFPLIRLFFAIPLAGRFYIEPYKIIIRKEMLYNYARKYSNYDYVYIDHGLAQSIIQLVYEHPDSLNITTLKIAAKMFQKTQANKIVYCKVKPETSLKRIRSRNNPQKSRLDGICEDSTLIEKLYLQQNLFNMIAQILDKEVEDKKFYYLDNE